MLKFSKDSDLRIELYEERIRSKGYVHMDKVKLESVYLYEKARMETMRSLSRKVMNADAPSRYLDMGREALYHYLTTVKGCPPDAFSSKNVKGFSVNADQVLMPLLQRGYAREFLEYYIKYSSLKSICSRAEGLFRLLEDKGEIGVGGNPVHRIYFGVEQQQNLRYNYNNTDLISIPLEFANCFTAEDGYVLAWGDFAQSDFRIAYNLLIRDERNAEIMDSCQDKYEGIARVLAEFEGKEFSEEEFREERDLYKLNVLQTIYGQRSGKTAKEKEFVSKFAKYLETCPRYMEFYNRISDLADLGLPLPITGYFGTTQFVPLDPRRKKSTIDKALNTPIQTGTSQIIILTVNAILDTFYELGYTEDDVSVYMVRHDEPVFKIKKEVLKDAWVFDQASKIIVDDWTPLELTFSYGYYYREENEELAKLATRSYVQNVDKIVTYEPSNQSQNYMPLPEPLVVNIGMEKVGNGKTIACIYSPKENAARYMLLDTEDMLVAYQAVRGKLLESQVMILEKGYRIGVVAYNEIEKEELYDQSLFFKFLTTYNNNTSFAKLLSSFMVYRYCKKYGLDCDIDPELIRVNLQSLQSVGDLSVIKE